MTGSIIAGVPGVWQVILIIVIVLLFFGGKKIPELMRGLGKGVGEFKKGMNENDDKSDDNDNEPTK
ncbi:MAG: twin-arginine translocase TatA/TatE family subunit [Bacteroidales bacterium]|nr:twin-arginine translocase TatA/TatE family subunit [Tenuifilaceae bacterium]